MALECLKDYNSIDLSLRDFHLTVDIGEMTLEECPASSVVVESDRVRNDMHMEIAHPLAFAEP